MKEDDMDEMLRQAAENYEVDSGRAADWNSVYKAVHEPQLVKPEEKRKRHFAFWWLLLIPLGWIANTEYNKFNSAHHIKNSSPASSLQTKTKNNNNNLNTQIKPENTLPGNTTINKNIVTGTKNIPGQYHQPVLAQQNVERKINNANDLSLNNSLPKAQSAEIQIQDHSLNETAGNTFSPQNSVDNGSASSVINKQENSLQAINTNQAAKQNDVVKATTTSSAKKEKINNHYFYAGLVAGGDLSFVKFQKMQSVGYNAGLLAGYKFNKLSIESGILLDKKNYYTKGEYFDKSKIDFFNNAQLFFAKGYCRMYEIPLNLKYDFSSRQKHVWFATAGLSSYIMNKEFYHFDYSKNGTEQYGSAPYYHTTKNWFSVLNLSAGYQLQTGGKTNLRIEPYYKTTLSGVGTGSLSISSAGINIGIVKQIH